MLGEISTNEVFSRLSHKQKFNLLDVRTKNEFDRAHLNGAILLPLDEITLEALDQIGLDQAKKDEEIIVYCLSGPRGDDAVKILKKLGYTNIKNMTGGLLTWRAQGYGLIV